jgi:serine/threonine-protein kinase
VENPASGDRVIGQVINNYEIKSVVAEGGMGKVYLAEHPFMGRRAAIKILRGMYLEDKTMVARFVNEARAANAIHHPNIVEIIDVGYLPDGPPYLMMEFLEGETLGMRLNRLGRLSPAESVRIIDQAASALEAAHAAAIVHRDLKPDNLFVVPDASSPGDERLKVVDFGIAKLETPGMGESVRTTGVVLGTPNYMSPEQCRGAGVDQRTDIYALGAILYQMLCGKPPFVSEAQIDVMMMHVVRIPTAPRELFPEIPDYLDQIVMRALAKNPDDRFASMSELRAALVAVPTGPDGLTALPPEDLAAFSAFTASKDARRRHGRRRWLWVSAAVVLGIGVGWVGARRQLSGVKPETPAATTKPQPSSAESTLPGPLPAPASSAPAAARAEPSPPAAEPASDANPIAIHPRPGQRKKTARHRPALGVDDRPLAPESLVKGGSVTRSDNAGEKKGDGSKKWMNKW